MTETTPTTTPSTSATTPTKPRVRYLGGARYLVESRSRPGIGQQVDTSRLKCTCPAGRHGRRCHHLTTALAYEDWRRREIARAEQAQPAPPVAPVPVPATVGQQTGELPPLSRWFE